MLINPIGQASAIKVLFRTVQNRVQISMLVECNPIGTLLKLYKSETLNGFFQVTRINSIINNDN